MPKTDLIKMLSIVPIENVIFRKSDKALDKLEERIKSRRESPSSPPQQPAQVQAQPTIHEAGGSAKNIATGCTSCSLGHFSTTSGLLNEAYRFREKGVDSDEVADRIGMCLSEQNSLERVDLTPDKIQTVPEWERPIAEEALQKSRGLRHKLEDIKSINELEEAAAEASNYYRDLNRQWMKARIGSLSESDEQQVEQKAVEKLEQ